MLVVEVGEFGGPEVLVPRQVPDPAPGAGQVVVRVAAVDVLFVDTLIRSGLAVDFFPVRPPYVPGNGVAGLVSATGDGVDPSWAGRAVVARTGGNGGWGGYVEQAVVSASDLIPVPDGLGLREAGALLHDGATGESLLERAAVRSGESVLVTAAAGGMGVLLVQFASAAVHGSSSRAWRAQARGGPGGRRRARAGLLRARLGQAGGGVHRRQRRGRGVRRRGRRAGRRRVRGHGRGWSLLQHMACPMAGSPRSTRRTRPGAGSRCTASRSTSLPTSGGWRPGRWPTRPRAGSSRSSGRPSRWNGRRTRTPALAARTAIAKTLLLT